MLLCGLHVVLLTVAAVTGHGVAFLLLLLLPWLLLLLLLHLLCCCRCCCAVHCNADAIDKILDINIKAALLLVQAAAPHMKRGGRIILISSVTAYQ
jgi:NAD(P)-dependent dehydrogenase (short-subunit alcohol dehydrogenase family)